MFFMRVFTTARRFALIGLAVCLVPCFAYASVLGIDDKALSGSTAPEASASSPGLIPMPNAEINAVQALVALYRGKWDQALELAATAITHGTQDIEALGAFAVSGAVLRDQPVVKKALPKLLEVESPPHYSAIAQAILSLQDGSVGAAEGYLDQVSKTKPKDPLALYFRGEIEHMRGNTESALTTFRQVSKATPEFAPALVAVARLLPENQTEESIGLMERAVAIHPTNVAYRRRLADLYAKVGRQEEANRLYAEILKGVPGVKDQYLAAAWQLQRTGRSKEALRQVEKAVEYWGQTSLGSLVSAMASVDLGETKLARKHLTDYLLRANDKIESHLAAGLSFLALGDPTAARKQFKDALLLHADNSQVLVNLAVAAQMDDDVSTAKRVLGKAEQIGESLDVTAFVYANLEFASNEKAGNKRHKRTAESLFPGVENLKPAVGDIPEKMRRNIALQRNVMLVMFLNRWYTQTVRQADLTLATLPDDAASGFLRALALELQDKLEEARDALEKLIALDPRFIGAHLALGRVAARLNDSGRALSAFQAAEELAPRSVSAKLGVANALLALGEHTAAINELGRAERQANGGQEMFHIALAYRQAGELEKFRILTKSALATGDQGSWRQQAMSMLSAVPH